jgi:hypothetical protein
MTDEAIIVYSREAEMSPPQKARCLPVQREAYKQAAALIDPRDVRRS